MYDEMVGTSEVQDQAVVLDTGVIFENMVRIYQRDFEILRTANEISTTANKIATTANEINTTANEIKKLVTAPKYDTAAKFAGCDGIDQDFDEDSDDNKADNCEEDNFPPEIVLLDPLPVVNPMSEFFRLEKTFSKEEAISYLKNAFQVIDDCSRPALLSSEVKLVGGSCLDTEFEITPIQEKCPDSALPSFLRGGATRVILDVDDEAPLAFCGFRQTVLESSSKGSKKTKGSKQKKGDKRDLGAKKDKGSKKKKGSKLSRFVDGKTLFIREVGSKSSSLVDTEFFFDVEVRLSWSCCSLLSGHYCSNNECLYPAVLLLTTG
jgi:hypothetical protein